MPADQHRRPLSFHPHFYMARVPRRACVALFALVVALVAAMPSPAADVAASNPTIMPVPASITAQAGQFDLTGKTPIIVPRHDADARRAADRFNDLLYRTHGLRLVVRNGKPRAQAINLVRDAAQAPTPESYRLEVSPDLVRVSASSYSGFLYGNDTLSQLVPAVNSASLSIAAVTIVDAPRFAWRGLMLDSARHYQSPDFIKRYLDVMALHKLNTLHWHLTDDQAWRLEIRKYPKLTSVGAWRVPAGPAAQADIDQATGKPRRIGGFYTQAQVRDIVAYASDRGIRIVPEIEMPGHASATLVAYPQFAASATPPADVPADWGIYPNVYSPDDATLGFLTDVLTEVMDLFPGEYIHVGGDEVEKEQWQHSPAAQARLRELGTTDVAALPAYFTRRIGKFLEAHGRKLVGWDEILHKDMAKNAVVMSWRGTQGALDATAQGHDAVLSAWPTLYFDNRQGEGDGLPGRVRMISLKDVYDYSPIPAGMSETQQKHLIGIQGNVWTEHIRTEDRAGAMSFPRAAAIADLGWTGGTKRDWPAFVRGLPALFRRYEAFDMPYSRDVFAVRITSNDDAPGSASLVTLANQAGGGEIRYTVDGSAPTSQSSLYGAPVLLPIPGTITATTFAGDQAVSNATALTINPTANLRRGSDQLQLCSDSIPLMMEDDAPIMGQRAVFKIDIQKPCWIVPKVKFDGITAVQAAVGNLPFNFQIGEAKSKVTFPAPTTAIGELVVRLDTCEGKLLARLPLAPAALSQAVTVLPAAPLPTITGTHDVCLRFAQPTLEPMWALDWIELTRPSPAAARKHAQ